MADLLNSDYLWGINSLNEGKLSQREVTGLGSLAPQAGYGLTPSPNPASLYPTNNLPKPDFSPSAGSYFGFESDIVTRGGELFSTQVPPYLSGRPYPEYPHQITPQPNLEAQEGGSAPYMDPNYPYESLLALKNYLAPQVSAGEASAKDTRGLTYSGSNLDQASNYLNQISPANNTNQALYDDMSYLYGSNIANSLVEGGGHGVVSGGDPHYSGGAPLGGGGLTNSNISVPASLPNEGVTPLSGGTNDAALLMSNPAYNPNADTLSPLYGLLNINAPSNSPKYDQPAGYTEYPTPGYVYSPYSPPDLSRMPWLAQPTAASTKSTQSQQSQQSQT